MKPSEQRLPVNKDHFWPFPWVVFVDRLDGTLLMELWGGLISYSSYKNKHKNLREKYLIKTINDLENSADESNIDQIKILRTELYDIRNYKMKGQIIRSKA